MATKEKFSPPTTARVLNLCCGAISGRQNKYYLKQRRGRFDLIKNYAYNTKFGVYVTFKRRNTV